MNKDITKAEAERKLFAKIFIKKILTEISNYLLEPEVTKRDIFDAIREIINE